MKFVFDIAGRQVETLKSLENLDGIKKRNDHIEIPVFSTVFKNFDSKTRFYLLDSFSVDVKVLRNIKSHIFSVEASINLQTKNKSFNLEFGKNKINSLNLGLLLKGIKNMYISKFENTSQIFLWLNSIKEVIRTEFKLYKENSIAENFVDDLYYMDDFEKLTKLFIAGKFKKCEEVLYPTKAYFTNKEKTYSFSDNPVSVIIDEWNVSSNSNIVYISKNSVSDPESTKVINTNLEIIMDKFGIRTRDYTELLDFKDLLNDKTYLKDSGNFNSSAEVDEFIKNLNNKFDHFSAFEIPIVIFQPGSVDDPNADYGNKTQITEIPKSVLNDSKVIKSNLKKNIEDKAETNENELLTILTNYILEKYNNTKHWDVRLIKDFIVDKGRRNLIKQEKKFIKENYPKIYNEFFKKED